MKFDFALADQSPRSTRRKAADVRLPAVRLMAETHRPRPDNSAPDGLSEDIREQAL
jgi:hypothetical protein